jgi:hypothetical protein
MTWLGPEGGVLLEYLPNEFNVVIFLFTLLVQISVIVIYFIVGKRISSFSKISILSILNVLIVNALCVFIIKLCGYDIFRAFEMFSLYGGSPSFVISLLGNMNILTNVISFLFPVVIMILGNIFACNTR